MWGEERGLTKRLEIEPIVPPEFCFLGLVDLFKDSLSTFMIDTLAISKSKRVGAQFDSVAAALSLKRTPSHIAHYCSEGGWRGITF